MHGDLGMQPGVVDMGGGGHLPKSQEGRPDGHEELHQEAALTG